MSIHQRARDHVLTLLADGQATEAQMHEAFDFMVHYRCLLLSNTIAHTEGPQVRSGPFAGMAFVNPANGYYAPLLLGCYEEELHDTVRALPAGRYGHVINIGCGEGYYAVGLKRLLPSVELWAHDIDPILQEKCRAMAALNGVDIHVGGLFASDDFAAHTGHRTLVWCDIEGAEEGLLDPVRSPALADMDILVELHPTDGGHTRHTVPARFAKTHEIEMIEPRCHVPDFPDWLRDGGQLNQLLAQFEWRGAPTPWAMMRSRTLGRAV